ncbi:type VII secretion target [Mycolicibacterium fortuitum]|uniref:type VII secretion target n=1 Tax=Mycolicibacterium fortuitum TaxID=1766 RepID=UPI001CE07EC9|nr:type VII secretion target [Mycolicibacterium fortuitum]MCA4727322.1 hypothetical protein [Mycolicibacterium fortuitum]
MTEIPNPRTLTDLAKHHEEVSHDLTTRTRPDAEPLDTLHDKLGPVATNLIAAIHDYQAALNHAGTTLASDYDAHAEQLRAAGKQYKSADEQHAADFAEDADISGVD